MYLASSFTVGVNSNNSDIFRIRHPICHKCYARSMWFTAYHASIMMTGGASFQISFLIPSIFLVFDAISLGWHFSTLFLSTRNIMLGFLPIFLLFNAGGLGFIQLTNKSVREQKHIHYSNQYPHIDDLVTTAGSFYSEWGHPIYDYFLKQRSSPLIISIVYACFITIWLHPKNLQMIYMGILIAFFPALHQSAHFGFLAFFVIFVSCIYIAPSYFMSTIQQRKENGKIIRECYVVDRINVIVSLKIGLITYIIFVIVPLFLLRTRNVDNPYITINNQWKREKDKMNRFPFTSIWFRNLGFFVFIIIGFGWFFCTRRQMIYFISSLGTFIIFNVIQTETNSKSEMNSLYPFFMTIACNVFIQIFRRAYKKAIKSIEFSGIVKGFFSFLFIITIASSVIGYFRTFRKYSLVWTKDDENVANYLIKNTNPLHYIFTNEKVYNPVMILAGRRALVGNYHSMIFLSMKHYYYRSEQMSLLNNASDNIKSRTRYWLNNEISDPKLIQNNQSWVICYHQYPYIIYNRTTPIEYP